MTFWKRIVSQVSESDTLSTVWSRLLSAVTVSVTLAGGDVLAGGTGQSLASLVAGIGVALLGGLLLGALWVILTLACQLLPTRFAWVPWSLLSGGFFFLVATDLRAFQNLGTRYHQLAVLVLAACAAGTLGLALLAALLQPGRNQEAGWLMRVPSARLRLAAAIVMFALGASLVWIDRTQFPGAYEFAHTGLRVLTVVALSTGCLLTVMRITPSRRALRAGLAASLAMMAWPFFGLSTESGAPAGERPFVQLHLHPLRSLLDFDRDGYSHLLGGVDCEPFNARVNPGAPEVAGNGIDDNCLGGDAQNTTAVGLEHLPIPSTPAPLDVLLVTVDTLRADRMSAYGYKRDTTPHIKKFASQATRFDAAYTTSGWTSLAVPSLMRGLYPRRLSWEPVYETNKYRYLQAPFETKLKPGETIRARFLLPVSDPQPTLGDLLRRRGMKTAAVVDGGFTEVLAARWGADRGFDTFLEVRDGPAAQRNDIGTATAAIKQLRQFRRHAAPFFLWVHFFGPHAPDTLHKGITKFGPTTADAYDHELVYLDRAFGTLLDAVNERAARRTAILLSSDHGEVFFNAKSRGHGLIASDDLMRVPLIVKAPGYGAGEVSAIASTVDIVPTILDLTETPGPKLDGVILSELSDPHRTGLRTAIFEGFIPVKTPGSGSFKTDLIVGLRGDVRYVYDRIRNTRKVSARTGPGRRLPFSPKAPVVTDVEAYLESAGAARIAKEPAAR